MGREFDRNMFIMLLSIMVGVIIITYFVGDIVNQSTIETLNKEHKAKISNILGESENFTSMFLKSNVLLDKAREQRAEGNYNFDLAFLWYTSALNEKNETTMELYKSRGTDNCTNALPNYINSRYNFIEAQKFFQYTKSYTNYAKYITILDIYIGLTGSGSNLTMYRYDACIYLTYLTENLTFDPENNNVTFLENVSFIMMMFDFAMGAYEEEQDDYDEYQDEIDEYEFFDEIR